jgi:hypothetical protein
MVYIRGSSFPFSGGVNDPLGQEQQHWPIGGVALPTQLSKTGVREGRKRKETYGQQQPRLVGGERSSWSSQGRRTGGGHSPPATVHTPIELAAPWGAGPVRRFVSADPECSHPPCERRLLSICPTSTSKGVAEPSPSYCCQQTKQDGTTTSLTSTRTHTTMSGQVVEGGSTQRWVAMSRPVRIPRRDCDGQSHRSLGGNPFALGVQD